MTVSNHAAYSGAVVFDQIVRWRASDHPERTAFRFLARGEELVEELTYGELDRRARALATRLQDTGQAGDRALLILPPGLDFVVAFVGCLYSGRIAVPLSPPRPGRSSPALEAVLADARPRWLLDDGGVVGRGKRLYPELEALESISVGDHDDRGDSDGPRSDGRFGDADADAVALIQYTSGSTRRPRGVVVRHRNLLHNQEQIRAAFGQSERSVVVSWLPLYHDMGLLGAVLQPLYCGATCVLMPPASFVQRPRRWLEAIDRYRGTTSGGPDFGYAHCLRRIPPDDRAGLDLSSWRVAFNGAEPVRADTMNDFAEAFAPAGFDRSVFFPCYGLAEATLFVTGGEAGSGARVERFDSSALEGHRAEASRASDGRPLVACGRPRGDQRVAVVEPLHRQPLPSGQVGEIWVSGESVAAGYWGRRRETARTFGARLVGESEGRTYLRTGDLGFVDEAGDLFVAGRLLDLMVLRGRNLHPHDLEAIATASKGVGGAAAFEAEVEGDPRAVAVIEVGRRPRPDEVARVSAAVRAAIAAEMEVAAVVVPVSAGAIPRTTSGKVRRSACRSAWLAGDLPVVELPAVDSAAVERVLLATSVDGVPKVPAPGGGAEACRRAVLDWLEGAAEECLEGAVDPERPLVEQGLDSLAASELAHRITQTLGSALSAADLLGGASLVAIATTLSAAAGDAAAPEPPGAPGRYPLSPAQLGLWIEWRRDPDSAALHIAAAAELDAATDADRLAAAVTTLTERHAALRTRFPAADAGAVQEILAEAAPDWQVIEAAGWSRSRLRRSAIAEAHRPFDLATAPAVRLRLFRRPAGRDVLLLAVHHLVADLGSFTVMIDELGDLVADGDSALAPVATDPPAVDRWRRKRLTGERGDRLRGAWRRALDPPPEDLDLATDRPRPARFRGRAASVQRTPRDLSSDLEKIAAATGVTPFTALLAGWRALLLRHGGGGDLLIATPSAGRDHPALARTVGYLVERTLVRNAVGARDSFAQIAAAEGQALRGALERAEVPLTEWIGELLSHSLGERDPSRPLLAQTVVNWQAVRRGGAGPPRPSSGDSSRADLLAGFALGVPGVKVQAGGLGLVSFPLERCACQVELELTAASAPGGGLLLDLLFDRDLYDAATARRLLDHLASLLSAAAAEPARRLSELPLLSLAERRQLAAWNDTGAGTVGGALVPDRIVAAARRYPQAPALIGESGEMRYEELIARARAVAARLQTFGVGPEAVVAVVGERSTKRLVGFLSVFFAGAAYLPLPSSEPSARVEAMLAAARPAVILVVDGEPALPTDGPPVLRFADVGSEAPDAAEDPDWRPPRLEPEHPAYVLFTSGSTGQRKGVIVPHGALLNRLVWMQDALVLEHGERVLHKTPAGFDVSVWEMFWPLMVGAAVVVARPGGQRDPEYLAAAIERFGATTLHFVPSLLAPFLEVEDLPELRSLRRLVTSGEALTGAHVARFFERRPVRCELFNLYGPTEAAIDVSWWRCEPAAGEAAPPIGHPIDGIRLHVLDGEFRPVPVGVPGELHIAGAGLARGYLGDPVRTAATFVPEAGASEPGARAYRSGDRVRRRADGAIEFLGRVDRQVKVRGVRIEPGEVEAALAADPAVRRAAVVEIDGRLVAYWEPAASEDTAEVAGEGIAEDSLRRRLGERLPAALVPSRLVAMDRLPLTASGKLDRRSLPAPPAVAVAGEPPRGEAEAALAAVWQRVLETPVTGREASFFALGGDSIRALQVVAGARESGLELVLDDVFGHPTLAALAAVARPARESGAADGVAEPFELLRADERLLAEDPELEDAYPLSRVYAGLIFHCGHSSDYEVYVTTVRLRGRFDGTALAAALTALVARHPALRTSFDLGGFRRSLQRVHRRLTVHPKVVDLRPMSPSERRSALQGWLAGEPRRGFDWRRPPLLRVTVHRLAEDDFQLTVAEPILDGWSVARLLRELLEDYALRAAGGPVTERPSPSAAPRHHVALELAALESPEPSEYWCRVIADAPRGRLPEAVSQHSAGRVRRRTSPVVGAALVAAAERLALPLKSLLLAVHAVVMGRITGEDDVLTGMLFHGRPDLPDADRTLGLFLNPVCLRLRLGNRSWADLAAAAAAAERQMLPYRRYPMAELVRKNNGELLFDGLFNFTHFHVYRELVGIPGLEIVAGDASDQTYYPLTAQLHLDHESGRLEVALDTRPPSAGGPDAELAEEIVELYLEALSAAAANPAAGHLERPLLAAADRQRERRWNATAAVFPQGDEVLHELVASTARRYPTREAVRCGERALTYGELTRRFRALAARLVSAGVVDEHPVAVCCERSSGLLVALLGVAAAGAAFLPLDPEHPEERLAWIAGDALSGGERPVVVADAASLRRAPALAELARRGLLLRVDDAGSYENGGEGGRLDSRVSADPDRLAYVFYTSGSTGRPKGVAVSHRSLVNRLLWGQAEMPLEPGEAVLHKTSIGFDVSLWELFWPLVAGGRVVMAPPERIDPASLAALIRDEAITTAHFVPSLLRLFLDDPEAVRCGGVLRRVVASGEALAPDLVARFFQVFPQPGPALHNLYGPTEAAIEVTAHRCTPEDAAGPVPLGLPVANTRMRILDRFGVPLAAGVAGELALGGVQLARGYLGRPALTAERFVPDPLAEAPGDRLYRTGDRARRRRADGVIEYLGRLDAQFKLRGQRIEPGEVEAALLELPEVREAAVDLRGSERDARLVGWIVPRRPQPDLAALRRSLAARLPHFMVPAELVTVEDLPRTGSGKIDRRALPAPAGEARLAELLAAVRELSDAEARERLAAVGEER
ncbi:MAG: amino acid adenylation domain-containing protein [Acidobacteriota bacterium]